MVDMTRKLWQPATARKRLLNTINNKVSACNNITNVRLDNCRLFENASINDTRTYLNTQRMTLFRNSHNIQREFDKLFTRLI